VNKDNTISNDKLKKLLEISEKENKALLKLALHDIRSPLNKLFALVGLFKMSDDPLSEEQADYLDKMELVIRDGLSRMRNLQDLKAVEEKNIEIFYEPIKVSKLVKNTIREQKPDAARKNIEINFAEDSLTLTSDKNSLLRILDQLLSNAIKFSPKHSNISIDLEETESDLLVHITDSGYGISAEEQKKLFKKFTPLSTRTTGGESVTGIGLYIASVMANNIGGSISYTNNDNSVFTLSLPRISMV